MDENLLAGDANPGGDAGGAAPGGQAQQPGSQQAQGEQKPDANAAPGADGKPAEGEAKPEAKDDGKPAAKAPEKYEFKAPAEGFVIDEALQTEFTPILKELDLTNEQAQKLVDFAPRLIEKTVDAAVAETLKSIGYEGSKEWAGQVKADKELGGDKLAENRALVLKARDQFASPELRKILETTPLGNHPELFRLFLKVGRTISEDGYVPGGKTNTSTSNPAQKLFPNMNP